MKEHATRILERVSSLLHPSLGWINRVGDRVGFWEYEKPDEEHPRFGEKGWQCPECEKWMHQGVKESHQDSHREEIDEDTEDANTKSNYETETQSQSRGDLVDDYNPDWLKDEEESGIEIQEATGGQNQVVKQKRYRKKWRQVLDELEENGKYVIRGHDYPVARGDRKRGPRGNEAAAAFKSDFKRMDLEYSIEVSIHGHKAVIRVDDI